MKNKQILNVVIIFIIVISFILTYQLINNFLLKDEKKDDPEVYLKNYKVNEYIPTYVSDEDMASIYLNHYINNMYYDIETAYNSLDNEYREKRFNNIEEYKTYIKSLNYTSYKLDRYYKEEKDGFIIFGVYDKNNNFFAFKTKGVMQYTVYLDDYTVEI